MECLEILNYDLVASVRLPPDDDFGVFVIYLLKVVIKTEKCMLAS